MFQDQNQVQHQMMLYPQFVIVAEGTEIFSDEFLEPYEEEFNFSVSYSEREAFSFFVDCFYGNKIKEDSYLEFQETFMGVYDSVEAFMENFLEEMGDLAKIREVSGFLADYLDFVKIARDYSANGDFIFYGYKGRVYVYNGNV